MSGYIKYAIRKSGLLLSIILFSSSILILSKAVCAQEYRPLSLSWDFYDLSEYNPYLNWGFPGMGRQASSFYSGWGMDTVGLQRTTNFYNSGQNFEIDSKPILPPFTMMGNYGILTEDISHYYYPAPGVARASTGFAPVPYSKVPSFENFYWTFDYDDNGQIRGMGGNLIPGGPPVEEKKYVPWVDENGYHSGSPDPVTGGQWH